MTAKPGLRLGMAPSLQRCAIQYQLLARRLQLQRSPRDQFRLVEAPLAQLARMQRNRNHDNGAIPERGLQSSNNLGQHAPQDVRRRPHVLIFQQVDQFAQTAIVAPVGCRFGKWRLQAAA